MAVLKYIMRGEQTAKGEQTAQGKQKAYFCAHPDDYQRYFDKISNEILDTLAKENNRNCAFFYLEDANAERDDEFISKFREFDLIIIPVTTKFLTTANPALDIEFKLANEYHIPVLPIMMESGLEDVFNAKCGDIQFLDPNSRSATAISYEEKLTKYLTSVLIGDELAEKIRRAFDAYIFLSYRKKDRKYAQELMRLIHKNDFCRDIAIWYDEFLTPGEDFNDSIKAALDKSKLFALAVTPSLLEKGKDKDGNECENYVAAHEYPMAKERVDSDGNYSIFPAELVETDKKILAEKYDGIPECVNTKDEALFTNSLENALEGIALRENDADPEHNYLIGLAYLGGIDVEKDADRALELITSSANAGLPEAMKKLVYIYQNGEATPRYYHKAIEWQKKLLEYRKKEYLEKQNEDTAFAYIFDICDLGDYVYEWRYFEEIDEVYTEIRTVSEDIFAKFNENRTLRRYSILALYEVSNNYKKYGNIIQSENCEKAEECYRKSLEIDKKLVDETGDEAARKNVSLNYRYLGDICQRRGEDAGKYYRDMLDIIEDLANSKGTDWKREELVPCYCKIGDNCCLLCEFEDAEKYYLKAIDICEEIASKTGVSYDLQKLALIYDKLGYLYQLRGIHDHIEHYYFGFAEKYYRKELDAYKMLAGEKGTSSADMLDISRCYNILGNICQSLGKFEAARDCFSKLIDIREKLVSEARICEERVKCCDDLAISYFNAAFVWDEQKEEYLNMALDIWTQLVEYIPSLPSYKRGWDRDIVRRFDNILRMQKLIIRELDVI